MTVLAYQEFLQIASQKLFDSHGIEQRHAVLMVNFERLAELDGVLGFATVDEILQKISWQLRDSLKQDDLVGVIGRYQICCLLVDLPTHAHAELAAHRILRILTPPYALERRNIILAVRIGVAVGNGNDCALSQLMSNASLAIRQARLDHEPIKIFAPQTEDPLLLQIDLWSDLGNAIETRELYLGYQPQVHLASGKIESTEALLRWNHPNRGFIPTDKLIQVAEGTELMSKLTLWVFNTALRECAEYRKAGLNAGVSINFSADDLRDPELLELVMQGLSIWDVPAGCVTIELTETAFMENHTGTLNTLHALQDAGLRLAMDDFGTGYSSMARMLDLPLDEVQIDMVFVKHMITRRTHDRIVDSMINLAHRLNLSVVAEGVEDYATYERLRVLGCDIIQGYLIGKAMPLPELLKVVSTSANCLNINP
ncbi:MAG: GGDEF domain-containing protein [Nitrosomonas sp. PRO4]|nr:GGDEF domain-containing protein [Nitrosomonas sp. PRO4]